MYLHVKIIREIVKQRLILEYLTLITYTGLMKSMAQKGYTTATDFADYITKRKKLPFRKGYAISSKLVNYAESKKLRLDQLTKNDINKFIKKIEVDIHKIFDVENSMNSKTSFGGTSSKNVKKMIKTYIKNIR
mgnify:CR=1 FL=1